jgi:hypothetical protein
MPLLFVPSWETPSPEDLLGRFVTENPLQELAFQVSVAEYPFSDDTGLGLWIPVLKERLHTHRRKAMRKLCLTSASDLLRQFVRSRPNVVVAHGQGCIVTRLALNPEFRTVMYRSRSIVPEEQQQIESSVKQIKLVKLIGPLLHPRGDQLKFLLECLPEFSQSFSIPHTRV